MLGRTVTASTIIPKSPIENSPPWSELERHLQEVPATLRSTEVNQIEEMRQQGLVGDGHRGGDGVRPEAVRKYLAHPDLDPRYKPRPGQPTLLDP
jgi:hypothetical protein